MCDDCFVSMAGTPSAQAGAEEQEVTTLNEQDFMSAPRTRIHVYRMPDKLSDGYCFGTGRTIIFVNVDWFDAVIAQGQAPLIQFIKTKRYFDPRARFLIIADDPTLTFTIDPASKAP